MLGDVSNKKRYDYISSYLRCNIPKKWEEISILDIGCGSGDIDLYLGNIGFKNITGIDIDEDSIERAKQRCQKFPFEFKAGNIEDLIPSIPEAFWDCIICSEVIEHLPDPGRFLSMLKNLLKKDGKLFVSIPNGYGPWEIYHRSVDKQCYLNLEKQPEGRYHLQRFKYHDLITMMENIDFRIINSHNSNFISHVWPFTALGYRSFDFFERFDCFLADILPRPFVSGWYFWFELKTINN